LNTPEINEEIHLRLNEICSLFLNNIPLKRFVYSKFLLNEDGTSDKVVMVSTDLDSLRYYLLKIKGHGKDFVDAIRHIEEGGVGFFPWPAHTDDSLLNMYKKKFNLSCGLTIYKRHKEYLESWCFSGDFDSGFSTVLTPKDQKLFTGWACDFRDKFPDIISTKVPIKYFDSKIDISPLPMRTNQEDILKTIILTQPVLCGRKEPFLLTKRQYECLDLLSEGKTKKGIAKKLEISHRTVEDHLNIIKENSGFHYKNELIEMFYKHQENRNYL
jgi:DNA-binding CsgD family transcriptional regulator